MEILTQLLGRLHPVIVHLPIGFIILGLLLYYLGQKKPEYKIVIPLIFLLGGITASLACVSGYLLYQSEGFSYDSVKWHLWFGIITAIFCFLMYYRLQNKSMLRKLPLVLIGILLFFLTSYTGHLGGSITHGDDYLVEPLPNNIKKALGFEIFEEKKILLTENNWQEKKLYEDIIHPILNNKCVSCHNPKKSKGDLALNTFDHILVGGENGEVITANNPEESELYSRLILPEDNDDRMPPKDKTQLTNDEIKLIETWIAIGNPTEKSIKELELEKNLFLSFFPKINTSYPNVEVAKASEEGIKSVEDKGIHVENLSKTTNFLSVTCINKPDFTDDDFESLSKISNQIAVLDLGNTKITDAIIEKLATLKHLTILKLDNTALTGSTIKKISSLEHLKSVNLTNSAFEGNYLKDFTSFKKLEKVYIYNTNVKSETVKSLNNGKIVIDYGNYELPTIANDTIVY
ncbi:c-type cytochrome domain-containing protein [Aureibaculum sp. 2210JD6-5]|uniref:c-type cytochrome domain-containing protein n=1 Tax=Aureibaculum sp. 2210JD6-5 TaxID=3103957 RepID=UPI002AAED17B|nr:c-type cytochrome domain-containing protein [Aureibaculum sp. 2210JD6-5]MDY7394218.1 c-type cytochrome domain-containing protein [Aureibaculum sp. 2210JD6-5]